MARVPKWTPPATSIRDAVEGAVAHLVGRVCLSVPGLVSPIHQVPCAWYRVEVNDPWENEQRWPIELDEERSTTFVLEDATGRAHVEARRLLVERKVELVRGFDAMKPVMGALDALLERHGHFAGSLSEHTRFGEALLAEGELVSVIGLASWERDPHRPGVGYREPGRRLVIASPPGSAVRIGRP